MKVSQTCGGNVKKEYGFFYGQTLVETKDKRDCKLKKMAQLILMNFLIFCARMHEYNVHEIAKV